MTSYDIASLTKMLAEECGTSSELSRLQTLVEVFDTSTTKARDLHSVVVAFRHGLLKPDGEERVLFNYLEIVRRIVRRIDKGTISHLQYIHTLDNAKTLSAISGLVLGRCSSDQLRDKALETMCVIGEKGTTLWPGTRSLARETIRNMREMGIRIPKKSVQRDKKTRYDSTPSSLLLLCAVSVCACEEGREEELGDLNERLLKPAKANDTKTYERKRILRLASLSNEVN